MKKTWNCCRWFALLAVSVAGVAARADAPASTPAPPVTTTLPVSPAAPLHTAPATALSSSPAPAAPPDGIDYSMEDPEKIAEQTLNIQAQQRSAPTLPSWEAAQEQQAAADNRDWMLRDYTARLKKAGLAPAAATDPGTMAPSPYAAANTDPLTDPLAPLPGTARASKAAAASANKPEISSSSLSSLSSLRSILPPLNSPPLNAPRNAWGTESITSDLIPPASVARVPSLTGDNMGASSSSMDVPGLTAAESGIGPAAGSLGFQDALPDEPSNASRKFASQNNFLVPTAPTSDVTEFFKKQAEGLRAPDAPTVAQPLTVMAKPVAPVRPERVAKPAISGLRSHVDDPFDILRE